MYTGGGEGAKQHQIAVCLQDKGEEDRLSLDGLAAWPTDVANFFKSLLGSTG